MIYKIGKVIEINIKNNYVLFESNFNGYIFYCSDPTAFEKNKIIKTYIFEYKNDYTHTFYCFKTFKERILFEDLISIPGIGPKTALTILKEGLENVINLIANGDFEKISQIPYVSKKNSKQIIFDFQNKYKTLSNKENEKNINNNLKTEINELNQTLKILGFNQKQIDFAINKINLSNDVEKMLEESIKIISNETKNIQNDIKA